MGWFFIGVWKRICEQKEKVGACVDICVFTSRDREKPSLSEKGFQVWSFQRSGYVLSNEEKQRGSKGENG